MKETATGIVIDASVALAWCFPDEASDYADGVLVALDGRTAMVPAIWSAEITNALLVGERRKRIRAPGALLLVGACRQDRVIVTGLVGLMILHAR